MTPAGPDLDFGATVGAVVVNYNAKAHLLACVESLFEAGVGPVVVADNGSSDGSELALLERFPAVVWAPTGGNLGYGLAANVGAKRLRTKFLLVCNPDVVLGRGAVEALRRALEARPELAVAGPRIVDADGEHYPSARRFPGLFEAMGHAFLGQFSEHNPFTRRYRMHGEDPFRARDVDWVSGSCFMVRREAWEAVGGFDARYFMYMEDVDLCWRLRQAGWAVAYEPAAEVVHVKGASTDRHPYRMLLAHHVSMWAFARRRASGMERLALPFVGAGVALRFLVTVARRALGGLRPPSPPGRARQSRSSPEPARR
jgi:N-acetylglucosaminyl-diphospho-decaprenol L-rhamnosyltransferase